MTPFILAATPGDVIKPVFGYDGLRGQQSAIIAHALAGGDSLVLAAEKGSQP